MITKGLPDRRPLVDITRRNRRPDFNLVTGGPAAAEGADGAGAAAAGAAGGTGVFRQLRRTQEGGATSTKEERGKEIVA